MPRRTPSIACALAAWCLTVPCLARDEGGEVFRQISGRWSGKAPIVVNWTDARELEIDISIAADGRVTGRVGDAMASGEVSKVKRFQRIYIHAEYAVVLRLTGPLIRAEDVGREEYRLYLSRSGDQLTGFGASAGNSSWPLASKESRKRGMTLQVSRFPLKRLDD